MSKNIVYQTKKKGKSVAGEAKGIKLLRTNLQGGGTCDWVPEDETQLIPKVITQDGVYKASDEIGDIYGYSEVTVQGIGDKIMGDLGTITISKNGTYYAKTAYTPSELGESNSGDSSTKVGPFYGYRTVIVNVSGGSSSGSSSNSVSGNKNGQPVTITIDERGRLRETKLASRIVITTMPKFLTYHSGDKLSFKNIKVTAYVGDNVYRSEKYPTGVISESDLIFPMIRAEGSGRITVPVKWKRPEDKKMLETSYEITVNGS